jgi:hypothetical protein
MGGSKRSRSEPTITIITTLCMGERGAGSKGREAATWACCKAGAPTETLQGLRGMGSGHSVAGKKRKFAIALGKSE